MSASTPPTRRPLPTASSAGMASSSVPTGGAFRSACRREGPPCPVAPWRHFPSTFAPSTIAHPPVVPLRTRTTPRPPVASPPSPRSTPAARPRLATSGESIERLVDQLDDVRRPILGGHAVLLQAAGDCQQHAAAQLALSAVVDPVVQPRQELVHVP